MRAILILALALTGCEKTELMVRYQLLGIDPAQVVRVETTVVVDPADGRQFFADQPYRSIALGVGSEVRDFGSGIRSVLITHDATLGYTFEPTFAFRLLPPAGGEAPPLRVSARAVGASSIIGSAAARSTTFGPGAEVAIEIVDDRCGGKNCVGDQQCCGSECALVSSDVAHCGGCGLACGQTGDACSGSLCRCTGGSACSPGATCCSGQGCFDLMNDPFHCGACDKSCNPGETCSGGQCRCVGGPGCGVGGLCCAAPDGCSTTGSCPCGPAPCAAPKICCGGSNCVDLTSSDQNCGACGKQCAPPLSCSNGACACKGKVCGATDQCCANGCANLANDPSNCGTCGKVCAAGESCQAGTCFCGGTQCSSAQGCCGGACIDIVSDPMNCGGCGIRCRLGETCRAGSCSCAAGRACVGNETCCPESGCFDLASDPAHCGSCGAPPCPQGNACQVGACVQTTCVPPCTRGNQCMGITCVCNGATACADPQNCCPSGCRNLQNDEANCGMCGRSCGGNEACCGGQCRGCGLFGWFCPCSR
jgi:hypothetical protein